MARMSLGMVALVAVSACGQTERDQLGPMTMGGAGAGMGGVSSSGAGMGGSSSSGAGMGGVSSSGAGMGGVSSSGAGMGGLTGMGGLPQMQSAVAECERYCQTLEYRLPGALCEDWNRPGWDPPFCHLGPTTSCADYCSKVYEAVTPACAALLQPVIRCVAPTYANISVSFLGECWLADCRTPLFSMTSACYGLQEKLAAARATWQTSGVVDYQLQYDWDNDVKAQVVVRAGSEPAVTPVDAIAWTVPKLFDEVERYLHQPGVAPSVTYDADLGYVVGLVREEGCSAGSVRVNGTEVAPLR